MVWSAAAPAAAAERGGIAFHYAKSLTPRELEWYARFEVLVTHDPLPREQVDALHRRGTKLVLYEWAVAFYGSLATPWQRALPSSALLNSRPLRGHLGAKDADAFYYDPAAREHESGRAEEIASRLRASGYDGVFLDTTTAESVHPDALREFRRRHPDVTYDEAFEDFLRNLRKSVAVIVTNQGYRAADRVLPYVDWDVTESLITRPRDGRYVLRKWNAPKDRWNSVGFLMRNLIGPVQRKFPRVRFAHINYLDAADQQRIADIVAISRLYDAEPVVAMPDLGTTIESELLLLDLGEPKPRVEVTGGAYRFFERGLVAVNGGSKPMRVASRAAYENAVTGARVRGTIVVPPRASLILRRAR